MKPTIYAQSKKYDARMAKIQEAMGCPGCESCIGNIIGLDAVCSHPEGWLPAFCGELNCMNRTSKSLAVPAADQGKPAGV